MLEFKLRTVGEATLSGLLSQNHWVLSEVKASARLKSSRGVIGRCCTARAIISVPNHVVWSIASALANLSALLLSQISFFVMAGRLR